MAGMETKQEGSRWLNAMPEPFEVAHWFKENARLHDGLDPENYIGGLQLLSQEETVKVTTEDGLIVETERLVFTPYVRIDARIRYFWDLCELRGWRGEIAPARIPRCTGDGVYNENLGDGFFRYPVKRKPHTQEEVRHYIGCSMQASAYEPSLRAGDKGKLVMQGPPATKVVPMLFRSGYEDPNAPMRAETGAIGRALGLAGMLIIPGAGIATAEDMHEVLRSEAPALDAAAAAQLPAEQQTAVAKSAGDLVDEAIAELEESNPEALGQIREWMNDRGFVLGKLDERNERTVLRKLQTAAEAARK